MAIDVTGKGYILAYATNVGQVNMVDILYDFSREDCRTCDDLLEEIRRQATWTDQDRRPSPETEKRLRELAAVVMELKRMGLID